MGSDLFIMEIHYGGSFKYNPIYHYIQGSSQYFDNYDKDRFNIIKIEDIVS